MNRRLLVFCLLVGWAFAQTSDACKVPVFRYALERWPADQYRMVAIVDGEQSPSTETALKHLKSIDSPSVNVEIEIVDLSAMTELERWSVEGLGDRSQVPILQVYYPQRGGRRQLCWTGPLTKNNVAAWVDSPLRRAIVADVLDGATAVWVLVEGESVKENDAIENQMHTALEIAEQRIAIPEGVIPRIQAATHLQTHPGASMDDVLRSDIPLDIEFKIHRLRNEDDSEWAFREMIDSWGEPVDAPFVFPIFGRGRMIEPLSGNSFRDEAVLSACNYLVGECSCSVKALNPGVDLLLTANWHESLGDHVMMMDGASLGISRTSETDGEEFSETVAIPPGSRDRVEPSDSGVLGQQPQDSTEPSAEGSDRWVLGLVVMLFGGLAFWLRLRSAA